MKCPYCAEEVKDEAVVCVHCGRDFTLFQPLLARLAALEQRLAALADGPKANEASEPGVSASLLVVLCFILTSGFLLIALAPPIRHSTPAHAGAIVIPPLALGLALGFFRDRGTLRTYAVSGFAVGALNLAGVWSLYSTFEDVTFLWSFAAATFLVGQPLTFITSALLGNALGRRYRHPGSPMSSGGRASADLVKNVEVVAKFLTNLVSILTTLGLALKFLNRGAW